jgi:hypothetical protein
VSLNDGGMLADWGGIACYADFAWIAKVQFLRTIDEEIFQRVVGFDAALKTQYDACANWLERSN